MKRSICYTLKMNVIIKFMSDQKLEFSKLSDYTDMIKNTNSKTFCWVKTDDETDSDKHLFKYFYVYFVALKKKWREGCRNIVRVDGCFLKGAYRGELLGASEKMKTN